MDGGYMIILNIPDPIHWLLLLQITVKIVQIPYMMKKHSSNMPNGMLSCWYVPRNWRFLFAFLTPSLGDDCSSTSCCCSSCSCDVKECHETHKDLWLFNQDVGLWTCSDQVKSLSLTWCVKNILYTIATKGLGNPTVVEKNRKGLCVISSMWHSITGWFLISEWVFPHKTALQTKSAHPLTHTPFQ